MAEVWAWALFLLFLVIIVASTFWDCDHDWVEYDEREE